MKTTYSVIFLILITAGSLMSQQLKKEDWEEAMRTANKQREELKTQMEMLEGEHTTLQTQLGTLESDVRSCEEALFRMQGITREQNDSYQQEIKNIEKRLDELRAMDDIQLLQFKDEVFKLDARLEELEKSTFAMVPRYGDKIEQLHQKVESLLKSLNREKWYTVRDWAKYGDCLWNIAKNKDHYANAQMWAKIWKGNTDKIKDPDMLKIGWSIRIPEGSFLTEEEKKAALNHYRKKMEETSADAKPGN